MIINNLINGIRTIIGINNINNGGAKFKSSSDKTSKTNSEDSLYDTSLLSREDETNDIFDKIATGFKKLAYIFKSPIRRLRGFLEDAKSPNSCYSGLPYDVKGVIGQFASNMEKMPDEISDIISDASKMFEENMSPKIKITKDGIIESIDILDEDGNKTGSYSIIKYFTGEVKIQRLYFDKDGELEDGYGLVIHPDSELIETYSLFIDDIGEEHSIGSYFYSYDGECVDALNKIDAKGE